MNKVILISGKANCGKDTFSHMCCNYLSLMGYKCTEMAFAYYLKDICKKYLGWNGEKDKEGREMLQYIGTDIIRDKLNWNDFHAKRVLDDIQIIEDKFDFIFITDSRFSNECYLTRARFPRQTVDLIIKRPDFESNLTSNQLIHKSENGLDGYKHDIEIINDMGIEELQDKAIWYCDNILLEAKNE